MMILLFNIDSLEIKCEDNVTLLGINIGYILRFDDNVSQICKRASKQLAVLKRIRRFVTKQGKILFTILLLFPILITIR